MKRLRRCLHRNEQGQTLLLVLIILALATALTIPTLQLAYAGVRFAGIHQNSILEEYSADSGVEDVLTRLKYETGFADKFDSDSPEYAYDIEVNGHTVDLLVEWVDPATGQLPEGGPQAWRLEISKTADPSGGSPGQRLVVTYDIAVHNAGTSVFHIAEVGDWLPAGFEDVTYLTDSASGISSDNPVMTTVDGRLLLRWDLGESPGYRTEPGSTHHQIFQVEATMGWGTYMNYGWAVAKPNSIGFVSTGDAAPVTSARLFDVSSTAGDTTIKARLGLAEDGRLGIVSWLKE